MITLSKSGNTVTFTFDENSGYLQNGTIDVPVNSLSLVIDDSDMATFRKSASNDIFISARYEEFGMTKAQLEAWYKANMVDSITEEEIQDRIDTSTANYFDNAVYDSGTTMINFYHGNTVKASIDASQFVIDGMIDDVRIETISGVTYLVIDFNTASGKEDIQIPLTDIFDPSNYYTKQEVDASLSGKVNTTTYTAYTSSTQTTLNNKLNKSAVENSLNYWSTNPVQNKVLFNELRISGLTMDEENIDILENNDWTYDEGGSEYRSHYCPSYLRKVEFTISADTECGGYVGVQDSSYNGIVHVNFAYSPAITDPDDPSYPQDAHIDYTDLYVEANNDFEPLSSSTFSVSGATITLEIPNFIVYDEYEEVYKYFNWANDTDGDALRYQLYNNYGEYISGAVTASASGAVVTYTPVKDVVEDVEESLSGKQDTLSAGTNITISGNVISAEGGGKAVSGGTNISITTGATADTINCTLPITSEVNNTSIYFGNDGWGSASGGRNLRIGYNAKALGEDAICLATNSVTNGVSSFIAGGRSNRINGNYAFIGGGNGNVTNNRFESAVGGQYNNSVSASTTFGNSGNTLFSVGNGTSNNARHNAFEIRQNGDIYLTKDGQDVKLQDQLGGGEVSSAITSGDTNAVAGGAVYDKFDEVEQVTAAGLNAVNDKFGGLRLQQITQSAYDALTTKDPSTLYIIVN